MPDENTDSYFISDEAWELLQRDMYGDNAPSGSATPSTNIESLLSPDIAKSEAAELAQLEEVLVRQIESLLAANNGEEYKTEDFIIYPPLDEDFSDTRMRVSKSSHPIKGVGSGTIEFYYEHSGVNIYDSDVVKTPHELRINLHTDQETMKLAKSNKAEDLTFYETSFFFDHKGNSIKRIYAPGSAVEDYLAGDAFIEKPLTPGDFEMAGLAIQTLLALTAPKDKAQAA